MTFRKRALLVAGIILSALGLLWFLQGAGIVHMHPILCFADCEYISGASQTWEWAGAISFVLGIALIVLSLRSWKAK